MDLENKISKKNKIPGCDQLTRPEEIQALSKYLGEIKKEQKQLEKDTFKGLDRLYVPGKTTGKFPNVTLEDHIEALDVKQVESLSNSKIEMPGDFKKVELSKEKIKLEDNNNLQLDKTLVALKTNNNVDELETTLLKIKNDSKINSLSDKVVELDAENNVNLDKKSVILSEGDFKNTSLGNKQIKLGVDKTIENLSSKRVDLDVDRDIDLETKKEELNVTSIDNLSNKKVNLNDIEEVNSLSDKKIKLKNTSPIVSLEDKMLELIGEQKNVFLSEKVVKPINDLSSEVTSLYDTIDSRLKLVDDGVDKLEDKTVDAPDSTTDNNIDHVKQKLSDIEGDINIKLEGEALKYFEEIKKKLIIQGDKIGAFNTVMSLYKSLLERDQAHSDLWEKIIAVLSTYGATELPKANKEISQGEAESSFHKKKINVLSNINAKKDSTFNNYFSSEGTAINSNKEVLIESENNNENDAQDIFKKAVAVGLLPDSNQSVSLSYSYLSNVIQSWKEAGIVSSKSWLSEFSSNTDNRLISGVANFGINCLSNLQKKWSTNNSSSTSGNYSNSSVVGNRLKWSLPGASQSTHGTGYNTVDSIISGDIIDSAISLAEEYGADALTAGCTWVEKTEKQYEKKIIHYEYENNTLSEIDTSNLKDNAYYKVGSKVYRWEKVATTNFKQLGKNFEDRAKGVASEMVSNPKTAIKNISNKLISGNSENDVSSTIVYNRPKANGKTYEFEFPGNTGNSISTRKTLAEKFNTNLTSYTAKNNSNSNKGTNYLVLNGNSEKLNLNPNSRVFKDRYISSYGIQTTLKELCDEKSVSSVEDLKDALMSSEYITTINKVGTSSVSNRFAQTLDSNGCWEIVMEPFVDEKLNGGFSYLPAIQEINTINLAEHGINTGYNKWIPITSFSLQKSKLNSKSVSLFDGEFSIPLAADLVNELSITLLDDQYKSWRNYFQKVMDVSVYNSTPHEKSYYTTGYDAINTNTLTRNMAVSGKENADLKKVKEKNINLVKNSLSSGTGKALSDIYSGQWMPTAVDKNAECTALYKNITFRIKIYVMTQQYSTIRKFDLLAVLRDFSEEFSGDTDYSAADLNLNFSIVGEDPDHYHDPTEYNQTIWNWWKTTDDYYEEKKIALRLKTVDGTTAKTDADIKNQLEVNKKWEETKKTEKTLQVQAQLAAQEASDKKERFFMYVCTKPTDEMIKFGKTSRVISFVDPETGIETTWEEETADKKSLQIMEFTSAEEASEWLKKNKDKKAITNRELLTAAFGGKNVNIGASFTYTYTNAMEAGTNINTVYSETREEFVDGLVKVSNKDFLESQNVRDDIEKEIKESEALDQKEMDITNAKIKQYKETKAVLTSIKDDVLAINSDAGIDNSNDSSLLGKIKSAITNKKVIELRTQVLKAQNDLVKNNTRLQEGMKKNNIQLGNNVIENEKILESYGGLGAGVATKSSVANYRTIEDEISDNIANILEEYKNSIKTSSSALLYANMKY